MRRAAFLVLGLIGAFGACTNLDGLSGASPATDGGEADDAASREDALRTEPEAGIEDAGVTDGCVVPGLRTRICDAFERSQGVIKEAQSPESWTVAAGNVTLPADDAGAGNAAQFVTYAMDAGPPQSYLALDLGAARKVAFRGRIRAFAPPVVDRQIVLVRWSPVSSYANVELWAMNSGAALQLVEYESAEGGFAKHTTTATLSPSAYHDVALDIDLDAARIALTVDGKSALASGETFPVLPRYPSQVPATAFLGSLYSPTPSNFTVRFDDVVIATP